MPCYCGGANRAPSWRAGQVIQEEVHSSPIAHPPRGKQHNDEIIGTSTHVFGRKRLGFLRPVQRGPFSVIKYGLTNPVGSWFNVSNLLLLSLKKSLFPLFHPPSPNGRLHLALTNNGVELDWCGCTAVEDVPRLSVTFPLFRLVRPQESFRSRATFHRHSIAHQRSFYLPDARLGWSAWLGRIELELGKNALMLISMGLFLEECDPA